MQRHANVGDGYIVAVMPVDRAGWVRHRLFERDYDVAAARGGSAERNLIVLAHDAGDAEIGVIARHEVAEQVGASRHEVDVLVRLPTVRSRAAFELQAHGRVHGRAAVDADNDVRERFAAVCHVAGSCAICGRFEVRESVISGTREDDAYSAVNPVRAKRICSCRNGDKVP